MRPAVYLCIALAVSLALGLSFTSYGGQGSRDAGLSSVSLSGMVDLSNRIMLGKRPDSAAVRNALAWWKMGKTWVLESIWLAWPEMVFDLGTNAAPFFDKNDHFPSAVYEGLLTLRNREIGKTNRLMIDLYWLLGQKRYQDALTLLTNESRSLNSSLYPLASWLAHKTDQHDLALSYVRKLVTAQTNPSLNEMKLIFGLSLGAKEYVEAVYWGEHLIKFFPEFKKNLHWLNNMANALHGRAAQISGEDAHAIKLQALQYIDAALMLSRSAPVLHTAALVHASLSNYAAAAQHLQLALALDSDNTNLRALLGSYQRLLRRK